MGNLIRTVGFGGTNDPVQKRTVGILSDGSVVMMVADMHQAGVSGDGGDGSGLPKYHFYHSTDRVNWTLKATFNAPAAGTQNTVNTFCVDSANNLHVAYRHYTGSAWSVRYRKLTYAAGPTWTVGTEVILAAGPPSGYIYMSLLDIDTVGNSTECVVVGAYWYNTASGAKKTGVQQYVRTTGGTWVTHAIDVTISGDSHLGYADDMTLSGDNQTVIGGDNIGIYSWYCNRKGSNGTDHGDVVYIVKINCATGARIGRYTVLGGWFKGYGGGFRKFWLFNTGSNQFTLAGVTDTFGFKTTLYRYSFNRSTNAISSVTPAATSGMRFNGFLTRNGYNHNWCAVAYNGEDEFFFFGMYAGYAAVAMAKISGGSVTFDSGFHKWDNAYGGTGGTYDTDGRFKAPTVAPIEQIFSGATRNWSSSRVDAMMFHHRTSGTPQSFRMESRSLLVPLAPNNLRPASGSTITTDRPTISANIRLALYYPQMRVKNQWQIASDAGFTTNLKTITETDDEFEAAHATSSPYNALVWHSETLTAVNELTQGTWYIRARTQDYSGNFSPWSSSVSFVVTHPPAGADLYPTAGAVFLYQGVGNVTFTWRFTDPSPYDNQTAYQIVVENAEDGSIVADSGKVTSSSQSAVLAIPVSGKDVALRWRLRLWDSDDIVGSDSPYHVFYVADPPAPTIDSPLDGAVLSSGIPTISWTPGIGGTKQQQRYRLMLTQGGNLIYTSDWVTSLDTSHTLPVGYLRNDQQYTIRVEIQDDLGLQGFDEISVSTDWVEPTGPADDWEVYLSEYAKRGFVYITWTDANMDEDFSSWNVYRRPRGESNWTQIATVSSGAGRYAHRDYFVGSGRTYEYTITQMVDRFGDLIESIPTKVVRVVPDADNYWLIDPVVPSQSIPLYQVTSDPFTEEYEQETIHIIGAGRHVEYGDRLGYAGSIASQLRDKFVSGVVRENYALNPALSYHSTSGSLPDKWLFTSTGTVGELSHGAYETQNPSPSGKTPYRFYAGGLGVLGTDNIRVEQQIQGEDLPDKMKVPGATVVLSAWVAVSPLNSDKRFQLNVGWLDAANVQVGSQQNSAPLDPAVDGVESYVPPLGIDASAGNATQVWRRLRFVTTVPDPLPVGMTGIIIKVRLIGNGGVESPGEIILGGVQFETGQMTEYFDGDQFGGSWAGEPYLSYSYGTGYYTARQQRQALERIKAQKTWVYLRNAFGDLWRVAPGDISVQRIAGVGRSEFVDIEMPYQEVEF